MPTSTYTYNLDGAMTTTTGESPVAGELFSSIRRHDYTRLPIEITGGEDITLRYDSSGRRLHKAGVQTIFYRNGTHHPSADRTTELEQDDEIHRPLVEHVCGDTPETRATPETTVATGATTETTAATGEIIYIFTPAGQTISRRCSGYVRLAHDHISSVRAEISSASQITAHYSAYGKAIITGGELRRAFAGYEPDAEVGLYNANRRLYAPTLRLFVSVDPRLQNASPYPYCGSDPFNYVDPTGGIASGIVSGIVQALIVIISVIITCATDGVGSVLFGVDAGAEATAEGATAAPTIASVVGSTMAKGLLYGIGVTATSNGADLIVKAAYGEHITAWQAVKSMLIEPLIAGAAGAASGAVLAGGAFLFSSALLGSGVSKIVSALSKMLVVGVSAMTYSAVNSIGTAAVNNQLSGSGENIGIQMAISFGEAALFEGAYLGSGVAYMNALSESSAAFMRAPSGGVTTPYVPGTGTPIEGEIDPTTVIKVSAKTEKPGTLKLVRPVKASQGTVGSVTGSAAQPRSIRIKNKTPPPQHGEGVWGAAPAAPPRRDWRRQPEPIPEGVSTGWGAPWWAQRYYG